jgi:hypothetical protein
MQEVSFMGYRSQVRSHRDSGRGRGAPRHKKAKAKPKRQKRQSGDWYVSQENNVTTSKEVLGRTLDRLGNLGRQVFAPSPFSEHFSRWLTDVRVVVSEFESTPGISLDDQFVKERSQILSNVELELDRRSQKEASAMEPIRRLSEKRVLLGRIEEEYTTRTRELERRKDTEIKRLSSNADDLRQEADSIARMKTGILRRLSKKAKAQREKEARQRLELAEKELASAVENFAAEQETLRSQYESAKQPVVQQIQNEQREIENQEIDGSLEARRSACETLINSVNALVERKGLSN